MANDMAAAIVPKSDQINSDDLMAGSITITIEGVSVSPGTEQPVSMTFAGSKKYYRPCKSMSRVFVAAWGPDSSKYVGKSVTLYRDPKVTWGGMEVGGIRISHMSDIAHDLSMALSASNKSKKVFTVKPLKIDPRKSSLDAPPAKLAEEPFDPITWGNEFAQTIGAVTTSAELAPVRAWLKTDEFAALKAADPERAQQLYGEIEKLRAEFKAAI